MFGYSVAISGDYAIVGAYQENGNSADAGAAYIFHRTNTNTWDTGIKITASDAESYDWFGYSVAISGDYAIAGAYGESSMGYQSGAAYIFHRTDTNTWDTGIKITESNTESYDWFGYSVAISGDYAIAGAYGESSMGYQSGVAYIFHRTDINTWDVGVKITASDAEAYDWFGYSVAISGDYAIAGAYGESSINYQAGAAYIHYGH